MLVDILLNVTHSIHFDYLQSMWYTQESAYFFFSTPPSPIAMALPAFRCLFTSLEFSLNLMNHMIDLNMTYL